MVPREPPLSVAYSVLGLEQGASLEQVKTQYRQLALRNHPDKNPSPDATAQFQRIGEAYNTVLRHLTGPPPSQQRRFPHDPHCDCGAGDEDSDFYSDDGYDYDDDDDYDVRMHFYEFIFQEFMRDRNSRAFSYSRLRKEAPPQESPEQYSERIRRSREEQIAAQLRREQQATARKAQAEEDRQTARQETERRQKAKMEEKKTQVAAQKKKAEMAIRDQQKKAQRLRSATFAAARCGDAAKVKLGIWEHAVDAAGGEVKLGCGAFASPLPEDPQETLLHIAAKQGNRDLVEWLDAHSADPEEQNSEGLTACLIAVKYGQVDVVKYFLGAYPVTDDDYKSIYRTRSTSSLLLIAVKSYEPEIVYLILENKLASTNEINQVWAWLTSGTGQDIMKHKGGHPISALDAEKVADIVQLMMRFGGFSPPTTPVVKAQAAPQKVQQQSAQDRAPLSNLPQTPNTSPPAKKGGRNRGRGKGKGRALA